MSRVRGVLSPVSAGAVAAVLLAIVQLKLERPVILAERFVPGAGWVEIAALALWAALLARAMLDPRASSRWRVRAWRLFSIAFFAQLLLGIAGFERFLMTGKLHLPVPAIILAGPLYRGGGLFMVILFAVTVLLVGPAWCSHLCYIGAWDDAAARLRRKPGRMPAWRRAMHVGMFLAVAAAALLMRFVGVPPLHAATSACLFGLAGVATMLLWSRRIGVMAHCTAWCPVGVAATWLGKISPFRVRIGQGCTSCGLCRLECRYDALSKADIERRRPASSCTLCGDCVGACEDLHIGYRFPGLEPEASRTLFVVLAASLHAVFLGVARI